MTSRSANGNRLRALWCAIACALFSASLLLFSQQAAKTRTPLAASASTSGAMTFDSPQQAADALVAAAEKFDEQTLIKIFGPGGEDLVLTGEYPLDRKRAQDFAAEAREKKSVSIDAKNGDRATLIVGNESWPFPVPMVKKAGMWSFDTKA